ncbi:hypothetical protein PYW08_000884 [Mythimna loreyi]|uniref:Uncharacterized protein n=1 Tax=Mythimna loreyi TaxID=667449 RepID=A0ACC2QZ34_9NEOP|nr:hypothetical protein PYW08_000884 [Mythimna loreyi]
MFGYSKEAVRVKVKKCEGKLQPELRKFSVDPQITSLEVLQSILVKAFDIKSDFTLSYRTADDYGQEIYLPLLSDWDLDAAFLKAHNIALTQRSEPCVQLKVDMRPFAEASEDWEPPSVSQAAPAVSQIYNEQPTVAPAQHQAEKQEIQTGFQGMIMNQVEKTFNMVTRALNLYDDPNNAPRPPLSDIEFRAFLDAVGQITNTSKLREVIYCGGIDPSLRKVVWKHILNVYPEGMTGKERMDYIKRKANEYYALRTRWKDCIQKGMVNADLAYVTGMVRKDVLRTDRHHNFYAGSDDNQNIASLFNILTTYALNHPTVSYCQGMSDLASPLLVTMGDEAHAYICLCALMTRLYPNFLLDGEAMTVKFTHLTESLQVYDPDFYNYLKSQQADDLLFCYRWLLLEMKREFAFDDALRMLEVLWASLPQKNPTAELCLKEKEFDPALEIDDDPPPLSPLIKAPRENAYTKLCAIRRQSSSFSLANVKAPKLATCKQMNHSLDENATRKVVTNSSLRHAKEFQSLDDTTLQMQKPKLDRYEAEKNKENNLSPKDSKLHARRSMKSVPEHEKSPSTQEAHATAWSSTGNLMNGTSHGDTKDTPLGNQIRLLRDKISVHNNKFFSSLDKLDSEPVVSIDSSNKPKVKMIKNLNEFLNFATGSKVGAVTQEKLQRTHSVIERSSKECPRITLTKTSLDDVRVHSKTEKVSKLNKNTYSDTNDGSSPDDSQEYYPMTTSMTRELRLELEHLDRQVFGPSYINRCSMMYDSPSDSTSTDDKPTHDCTEIKQDLKISEPAETRPQLLETMKKSPLLETVRSNARSAEDIYLWENPLHRNTPTTRTTASCPQTPDEQAELDFDGDTGEIFEEHSGKKSITPIRLLRKNQSLEPQELSRDTKQSNNHSSGSESSDKDVGESTNVDTVKNNQPHNSNTSRSQKFFSSMSQELENAKKNCESLLNAKQTNLHSVASTINSFQKKYEVFKPPIQKTASVSSVTSDGSTKTSISSLPPPSVFGGGNPFLMFLCLTVLLQHRDYIMRNRMDYNELAMHFDKMVRKHNVNRVLNQARQMYAIYLKQQAHKTGDITT